MYGILLASSLLTQIDFKPMRVPAACDLTNEVFLSLKNDNMTPWIVSSMSTDKVKLAIVIWANKARDEIVVTRTNLSEPFTCIVAAGDKDTAVLEK